MNKVLKKFRCEQQMDEWLAQENERRSAEGLNTIYELSFRQCRLLSPVFMLLGKDTINAWFVEIEVEPDTSTDEDPQAEALAEATT